MPNIIYILADDMGFSDLGCYGSEIATPNLDALAAGGLRFTQFYNTARCCPTRASLLTGLYPHQAGIGHMVDSKKGGPGYQNDLNQSSVTIAQALKPAGYRNYVVGKWHVTPRAPDPANPSKHNWPPQRGFDRSYGTIHGAGSFFDPNTLTRDNQFISPHADPEYRPAEYYYTDAISDHAVRFIREHAQQSADQPFLVTNVGPSADGEDSGGLAATGAGRGTSGHASAAEERGEAAFSSKDPEAQEG